MSEQDALRTRSGNVTYNSKLVSFLYSLLRDHLPAGEVEEIVQASQVEEVAYTNGYLAQYAKDLAERLKDDAPKSSAVPDLSLQKLSRVIHEALSDPVGHQYVSTNLGTLKVLLDSAGEVIAYLPVLGAPWSQSIKR